MAEQVADLDGLRERVPAGHQELAAAIETARTATAEFVRWLERQAPGKPARRASARTNYNWHLQNVQLVPMTWDDEVTLLKRELARAHASLKLEEAPEPGIACVDGRGGCRRSTPLAPTRLSRSTSPG